MPIYQHDCEACIYLGPFDEGSQYVDLYYCHTGPTVISRWGDEGSYDSCGLAFAELQISPALAEAKARAEMLGFLCGKPAIDEPQPAKPSLENGYRLLEQGEIIQEGDEFYISSMGVWKQSVSIGETVPDTRWIPGKYRRPLHLDNTFCEPCRCGNQDIDIASSRTKQTLTVRVSCRECDTWIEDDFSGSLRTFDATENMIRKWNDHIAKTRRDTIHKEPPATKVTADTKFSEILESSPTLTKREYFAGMAMQGMLAAGEPLPDAPVNIAVIFADQLISALSKGSKDAPNE